MSQRLRQFSNIAALSAVSLATLLLFTPLTISAGNPSEFSASFLDVQLHLLPAALLLVVSFGLLGSLSTTNGYLRLTAVLGAIAALLWLQANLLVWDYGVLDGRSIDWLEAPWRPALDTSIWVAGLLIAITAYRRFGTLLRNVAFATFLIQLVSFSATLLSSPEKVLAETDLEAEAVSRDAIFAFSSAGNVVQIVMDGFQTDIFEALLAENPSYAQQLPGFTVFKENLGAYPYTQMSIPAIMSGQYFRNQMPYEDFVDEILAGDTITNAAFQAGFEVDIAAQVALKNVYAKGHHSNAFGISNSAHASADDYISNDSARLTDLSLFRALPHFGKALVHRDGLWVFQGLTRDASYLHMQYFSDLLFLRDLSNGMRVDRDKPTYKLFHLMLSHRPTVGEADCSFDGIKATNREFVTSQSECSLRTVLAVLEQMKELGIYDNSTIVLMADHGAWVSVAESQQLLENNAIDSMGIAMAMPMLAVKPADSIGPLAFSDAPTSITDLPATLSSLLGLDESFPGESVFDISETKPRTRLHYTYVFGQNKDADGYLLPMHEKIVNGSIYRADSWQRGKRYYPNEVRGVLGAPVDH